MKVKKIIFLFIINLFNSIILPFSSNPDDLNLYFPTIEPLKMCTRHFVVDFSIFFWFPFFLSNLLLHPNHTVCKANVPEMITEDYISDVEEGIFIFLHFLFALPLLSCCFLYVLTISNLRFLFRVSFHPFAVVSRFLCFLYLLLSSQMCDKGSRSSFKSLRRSWNQENEGHALSLIYCKFAAGVKCAV